MSQLKASYELLRHPPVNPFFHRAGFLVLLILFACSDVHESRALAWTDSINQQDLETAMSLLDQDVRLQRHGEPALVGKTQVQSAVEWDMVLNSQWQLRNFRLTGDTLICTAQETNDWLKAVGVDEFVYDDVRFVVTNGLITSVAFRLSLKSAEFEREALSAFAGWAMRTRPAQWNVIVPDSVIRRSGANARLWMQLFRDFTQAGTAT